MKRAPTGGKQGFLSPAGPAGLDLNRSDRSQESGLTGGELITHYYLLMLVNGAYEGIISRKSKEARLEGIMGSNIRG